MTETAGVWATGVQASLPADAGTQTGSVPFSISSVSCASPGNCAAAGRYTDSSGHGQGLLLSETAGVWASGVEAPLPANAAADPSVIINSVSCPSAGNCAAVGHYFDSSGKPEGLLLTETAGVWATGVEASPARQRGHGPECRPQLGVVPLGGELRRGRPVHRQLVPHPGSAVDRNLGTCGRQASRRRCLPTPTTNPDACPSISVSCASAGSCSAVGGYHDTSRQPGSAFECRARQPDTFGERAGERDRGQPDLCLLGVRHAGGGVRADRDGHLQGVRPATLAAWLVHVGRDDGRFGDRVGQRQLSPVGGVHRGHAW